MVINAPQNQPTESLDSTRDQLTALKVQTIQEYFDKFENNPEKQEAELKKFGEWLNTSEEVQEKDAEMILDQCKVAIENHGYNFKEWPVNLIDLLDKFIKTQGVQLVRAILKRKGLSIDNFNYA